MSDEQKFRAMDWLVGVATLVALGIGGWSMYTTAELQTRVAVIEDGRYTASDAAKDRAEQLRIINQNYHSIRQSLSEIAKQQAVIAEKLGRLEAQP